MSTGYSSRGLMDKLGVKPGARVAVLAMPAAETAFWEELRARTAAISTGDEPAAGQAVIILHAEETAALGRLAVLREAIAPNGAIWVCWPKGGPRRARRIVEDDVRAAALACGLVDVKVASVSAALSGLKLVIPLAHRANRDA
jgi:hypothetical protein